MLNHFLSTIIYRKASEWKSLNKYFPTFQTNWIFRLELTLKKLISIYSFAFLNLRMKHYIYFMIFLQYVEFEDFLWVI